MNRRILWLIGLLVPAVLIFGGIADRAIVDQARSVEAAALSEADRIAGMAALAVRATLARHEISVVAGERPPGVAVYRVLLSSRQPLPSDSTRAYGGRSVSELDDLYKNSRETTAQGLPEAVVAAVARGTGAAKAEAADRLLSGRLPVHPDDLPYLAQALGVREDPRVKLLQARLRGALAEGALPVFPDFRRTLTDLGAVEGWSRRGGQGLGYEVAVSDLLEEAQVPGGVNLAGDPSLAGDLEKFRVVVVPDVAGFELAFFSELPGRGPVQMLRAILWAAVLTSLVGLVAVLRAVSREAAAVSRERNFLATVTHELRTPVAALRLFGETLAKGRGSSREYGALVAQESERLEAVVERVLATTRMDESPSFAPVKPGEIVSSAVQLVAARAERRGVTIDWKSTKASVFEAIWDGDAVRQALLNLLDNAIKHGRHGGHVEVRAELENGSLKLSVADDGPGIERRDRKRIFERFQRGETQSAGTGLGLYVVEQVANAHGGRVDLLTEAHRGCTFTLVLPLKPPGAQPDLDEKMVPA